MHEREGGRRKENASAEGHPSAQESETGHEAVGEQKRAFAGTLSARHFREQGRRAPTESLKTPSGSLGAITIPSDCSFRSRPPKPLHTTIEQDCASLARDSVNERAHNRDGQWEDRLPQADAKAKAGPGGALMRALLARRTEVHPFLAEARAKTRAQE